MISGLHIKLFYGIRSKDFFLSLCRFVVLSAVTSVSEVIVIFLQLIRFENTAAFFYSLLGLVSHSKGDSGGEISTRWHWVEEINHSRDSWPVLRNEAYKQVFHACSAIPDSFFYAYSAIVDSFVMVSFFLEEDYILQHYR